MEIQEIVSYQSILVAAFKSKVTLFFIEDMRAVEEERQEIKRIVSSTLEVAGKFGTKGYADVLTDIGTFVAERVDSICAKAERLSGDNIEKGPIRPSREDRKVLGGEFLERSTTLVLYFLKLERFMKEACVDFVLSDTNCLLKDIGEEDTTYKIYIEGIIEILSKTIRTE